MKPQKILVFCTYPSVYSNIVLDELLASVDVDVSAIIVSQRNLTINENALMSDLLRIKHSGFHYTLYLWLVTNLHSVIGSFVTKRSITAMAKHHAIPVIKTRNINAPEVIEKIKSINPDILLCAHFNQLVSEKTYSLASEAALNIHPSLLPDLKGVDPSFYALGEAYSETGATLHHLDRQFDKGEVIGQRHYSIKTNDSLFSLNKSLFRLGAELVTDYLSHNISKTNTPMNKAPTKERYDSWPNRQQVKAFQHQRKFITLQDVVSLFKKSP